MKLIRASGKQLLISRESFPHYEIGGRDGRSVFFPVHPDLEIPAGSVTVDVSIGVTSGGGIVISPPSRDPDRRALVHLDLMFPLETENPRGVFWEKLHGRPRALVRLPISPYSRPLALLATGQGKRSFPEHLVILEPGYPLRYRGQGHDEVFCWSGRNLVHCPKEEWDLAVLGEPFSDPRRLTAMLDNS